MRKLGFDQVGLGWRPELAAAVFEHLHEIDLVEVILDDHLGSSHRALSPLRTLAAQVPAVYHGVGLGLASSIPVEEGKLARIARTLARLGATEWSEHLAFVRAGGREIGHLAMPPRNDATLEGCARNVERAARATGLVPSLENVATLFDPPGSRRGEPEWVGAVVAATGAPLLLDLHNLYANAVNFGVEPFAYLRRFPLHRVGLVHLSGGKLLPEPGGRGFRVLDDHVHDVPRIVFDLLRELARLAPQPLRVVIERDGSYPPFFVLLEQLREARRALREGRGFRDERAVL